MSDEKQVNSDDLIKYVVGEVHLLYYLEKEVSEIKKEHGEVSRFTKKT